MYYRLMQHFLAAMVGKTTDQQLTALKEGDDPLTTSYAPLYSTGTEAQDSDAQQGLEKTPVSDISSSIPRSVEKGESIKPS